MHCTSNFHSEFTERFLFILFLKPKKCIQKVKYTVFETFINQKLVISFCKIKEEEMTTVHIYK